MNIFAKLNSNEYNNRLEKILENKTFDETVKNLLLSMLYKIENGYKDYTKVNVNAISKEEFMEKILYTIKEECFDIKIVTPETEESKPLEQENTICKIDINEGKILVYANEQDLLYSLTQMYILDKEYEYNIKNNIKVSNTYYEEAIKKFVITSKCINDSEVIRDFDGWSWNNNIKSQQNIEYNLIFQNVLMLNMQINKKEFYNKNYIQSINQPNEFENQLYAMILTLSAEKNENIKKEIYEQLYSKQKMLELMNDRTKLLNQITEDKKEIANEIKNIDEILHDKLKLQEEYKNRNSKLENKDKIFSISFLVDILEREREEKLENLKEKNKLLEPKEYLKQREKIENEYKFLKNVKDNLENSNNKKNSIISTQIEFLKCLEKQIENMHDKDSLEKMLYKFRYYCQLPIYEKTYIKDIEELQDQIKKVMNIIIDNCIDKEILTNFSNSASLCYNILKHIFTTKIIDLKEVDIKINKIKQEKKLDSIQYQIVVKIYDVKDAEDAYNETVDNLNLLNVKLNKKIPLFIK